MVFAEVWVCLVTALSVASLEGPHLGVPPGEKQMKWLGQEALPPEPEVPSLQRCGKDPTQLSPYSEEMETQMF